MSNDSEVTLKNYNYFPLCAFLFALFYLSSGFGNIFSNNTTLILLGVLDIVFVLFSKQRAYISKSLFIAFAVLMVFLLASTLWHGDEIKQIVLGFVYFFSAAMIVNFCDCKRLITAFAKVVFFLCVCSLLLWLAFCLFPSIVYRLPLVTNSSGLSAYTIVFSTIYRAGNIGFARNQGIFWEPGAFQTYINISLMIILFSSPKGINKKLYAIIYIITVITTFSTAGYLVMLCILICYFLNIMFQAKNKIGLKGKVLFVALVLIFAFVVFYNNISPLLKYQLFGKVSKYFDGANDASLSSTGTRINSVVFSLQAFLQNPLLGLGVAGMNNYSETIGSSIGTCTPLNWLAYYGIIFGAIMNYGLYKFSELLHRSKPLSVFLFLILLLAISSENYWRNPSILLFSFVGIKHMNQVGGYQNENSTNKYL